MNTAWTSILAPSSSLPEILGTLLLAVGLSYALAWGYELTYQGLSYRRRFVHSLILSCLTSCALMMALNYQVAVGLGLIGMMAMVRFRANIRDLWDMSFLFTALTVGVCCGLKQVMLACGFTAMSVLVALFLTYGGLGYRAPFDGLIRFWFTPQHGQGQRQDETSLLRVQQTLHRICRTHVLISVRQAHQGQQSEYCYQVALKSSLTANQLVDDLQEIQGISAVHLLMQDQHLEL